MLLYVNLAGKSVVLEPGNACSRVNDAIQKCLLLRTDLDDQEGGSTVRTKSLWTKSLAISYLYVILTLLVEEGDNDGRRTPRSV